MKYYITPQEYEQAAKNGISYNCFTKRIQYYGWKREIALTKPPQTKAYYEWSKVALTNGIKYSTFYKRVTAYGWDQERAATEPLQDKTEFLRTEREKRRKIPIEINELREKNGIPYSTFMKRISIGWDAYTSATVRDLNLIEGVKNNG